MQPLVAKIRASGYMPNQIHKIPQGKSFRMTKDKYMNASATTKGKSTALVKRNGMPVSYEPCKAPRSTTLAQIGRNIRNV